jgi:Protein of unknown function (DUF3618)
MSTQATGTDPGSRSATEIERDVQQSRAEIEHTLDAIQERLSPGQLVDQAVNYFRGGRGVDFARNLGDSIAANPIPVTLMGVGLAWMMISGQRSARDGDRGDPAYWDEDLDPVEEPYAGFAEAEDDIAYLGAEAESGGGFGEDLQEAGRTAKDRMGELGDRARRVGEQARERVGRAGTGMADRAHEAGARARYAGRRARQGLLQSLDEHPLVLGAIGLAIGAALGAALPATETEDELMGETGDKALRRATKLGREQVEKARDAAGAVAGAVVGAAREEAGRQGLTPKSSGEAAGATSSRPAGGGFGEPEPGERKPAGFAGDTPLAADPKASLDRP